MHHTSKPGLFPWFSIFTGLAGFVLQCWLLSSTDSRGLLPKNHIAGILSILLLALTLAVCFLQIRKARKPISYEKLFPRSVLSALGSLAGALALGYTVFIQEGIGLFRVLFPVIGVLGFCALLLLAYCRLKGLRPHHIFSSAVTVCLILRAVLYCRKWGAEPQLQLYFFPLLASVFLLLACYYRAELDNKTGNWHHYAFFNQAALFCCCLCIPGESGIFYLLAAIWMAADGIRFGCI